MGSLRVVFTEPQSSGGGAAVPEMTVTADRLVLVSNGAVVLDVPADAVRVVDGGGAARTGRLRAAHRNHGRAWSAAEESELRALWAAGTDMAGLEEHFGRSRGSIGSAARRLRLGERGGGQPAGAAAGDAES